MIYYFSLPDEGGENKIDKFLCFSVYFQKFRLRQGVLSFYWSHKGDEGADTDLVFQFRLPKLCIYDNNDTAKNNLFRGSYALPVIEEVTPIENM